MVFFLFTCTILNILLQSLKAVQTQLKELESKSVRTPQDEAEFARLQTKQQQILASGTIITNSPSSQVS